MECKLYNSNSNSVLGSTTQYYRQKYIMPLRHMYNEDINMNYKIKNIYILGDSQAALKALDSFHINSKLVWDCQQFLVILAACSQDQQA
jgi:hypothetical protein